MPMPSPGLRRSVALLLGEEATMLKSRMIGAHRAPPPWRETLTRIRQVQVTGIEQNEERCLEAMHWHDPVERQRTLRYRSHTLVDDNPASG